MALGTVVFGNACIISSAPNTGTEIAPAAGTYAPVSDLNTWTRNSTRPVGSFPVFGRAVAYQVPGAKAQSLSLGGFLSIGDTGQETLFTAEATSVTAFIKVLNNGTDGWSQAVKVGTRTATATPDGLQAITFDLQGQADAIIAGAGPIL
jgi:hypothetical protein